MQIQPGDLLFVWGHGLIAGAIEHITHGPSHVALFIDENTICEAQGGRLVGEQDLSFYLDSGARLEVWSDPTLTDLERTRMVAYAKQMYGTHYDYWLILLEALHFETGMKIDWYKNNQHLICSLFGYIVAKRVGHIWSQDPNPAPVDLLNGGVLVKKGELTLSTPA